MMKTFKRLMTAAAALGLLLSALPAQAADFTYKPPGQLTPGSGSGRSDTRIYVPNMRFPIEQAPAYANSQVWGHGGMNGPGGGQCDSNNYSYPWWDDFCETRSWSVPMCPGGTGHQGQDIRPGTCEKNKHWAVAAESGTITSIGTYTVTLKADNGVTRHRYMHMDSGSLAVREGQHVDKGDRLGRVSNNMGSTPTTIHLHYDLHQNVSGVGNSYVPPYMSLVDSYERLLGIPQEPCGALGADGGIIDDTDPCFELHGAPNSWRYVTDAGHNDDLHWTYAWDSDRSNWAQWHIQLAEAGTYKVEVFTVNDYATSKNARYVIRHDGLESEKRLDYSAGDGWRSLGEFEFAAGDDQWVTNNDDTGEPLSDQRKIIMDALRLTRVEAQEPEPDPEPEPEPDPEPDAGVPDAGTPPDVSGAPTGDSGAPGDGAGDAAQSQISTSSSCSSSGPQGLPTSFAWLAAVWALVRVRRRAER